MDIRKKMKIAIVTGASEALKYKEGNLHASESEVISHITKNMNEILGNIDQ